MSIRIGEHIIATNGVKDEATTEVAGLVRLATDEEAAEGLNNTKAVTPSQLSRAKVQVDEETIELDGETGLKATGLISKNIYEDRPIYIWRGTEEQYIQDWNDGDGVIQEDWVCFITDDGPGPASDGTIISDKTLTIQRNGITIGTFSANSSVDKVVNIEVPNFSENSIISLANSGTINLTDNSINTITPVADVTFNLPDVTDLTKFHEILVQIKLDLVVNIDEGTTYYFNRTKPDFTSIGTYNLIYEYDNLANHWVCGSIEKGTEF